jgi:transcription initiation factor TFIIB
MEELESNLNIDDINDMSDDALMQLFENVDFSNNDSDSDDFDCENKCYSCNSIKLINDHKQGTIVCSSCGQVQKTILDKNPEWSNYNEGKNVIARCTKVNPLLPSSSLSTSVSGHKYNKIKTLHNWTVMPYRERSLLEVLKEIQNKCRKACIFKCIEDDAKIIYKNICTYKFPQQDDEEKKNLIIRGVNRRSLIAVCVFYACRRNGQTKSTKEIAKLFNLKSTSITKGCKTFLNLMKIMGMNLNIKLSKPSDFVPEFCKILQIQKKYKNKALQIAENIKKLNIATNHEPLSIASASILLMIYLNDLTITKNDMAKKFSISEVTISKAYKSIEKYRKIIIDDNKTAELVKKCHKKRQSIKIPSNLAAKIEQIKIQRQERDEKNNLECNIDTDINIYTNKINMNYNSELVETEKKYAEITNTEFFEQIIYH